MMNHNRPQPRPGPACASVAPLVAQVVAQKRLHPEDASILRAHLETCDYCRAELDSYHRLDDALARHFAPPTRSPLSPDEINAIITRRYQPRPASSARPARPASAGTRRPPLPQYPQYEEPRRPRGYRLISALSALAAALLIAVIGLAIFISHAHTPTTGKPAATASVTPSVMPTATLPPVSEVPYMPGSKDILSSIYMVSADEGWAVGRSFLGAGTGDSIILHYTGGRWNRVMGVPNIQQLQAGSIDLAQVVMVSATEGWAVGTLGDYNGNPSGLILHYTGGRWSVQQTIAHASLTGLAMTSASDGWAVGGIVSNAQSFPNQSLLLHYDGHTWTSIQAPGQVLLSVAMTSATDGWIIGSTVGANELGDLLLRYNGSAWSQTPLPPFLGSMNYLSPISASDVWAVGFAGASGGARNADARFAGGGQNAFAHYDGKTWTEVQTPIANQDGRISSLFMDASNDGWAIGWVGVPDGGVLGMKMVYLHYTGSRWTEVNGPDGDGQEVLFMRSPTDGWAVGGDNATILRYHNGAWSVAFSG